MNSANHLIKETSPYLLQHAYNPVQWHAWNKESLLLAKELNKPMLISIGYSSCHWCHVMEKESFENEDVAKVMNENFICIKVDREERPDVDDVYMAACQLVSRRGCGWPLNAIALPDGRPVWATTYHKKEEWIHVLNQIANTFTNDLQRMLHAAEQLSEGISQYDNIYKQSNNNEEQANIHLLAMDFISEMDHVYGGRKGAPKFPMPNCMEFMIKYYHLSKDKSFLQQIETQLECMAHGGIYDQIEGGFARYAVDGEWKVPHFEKMLYDNAQLISIYSKAYLVNENKLYKKVIKNTIDFIINEWKCESGGYYSSFDADSEGKEGKYYCWSYQELESIINNGNEFELFATYFNILPEGNWDGTNVLHHEISNNLENETKLNSIAISLRKLANKRKLRIKPNLDDKVLTSWNALLAKGFCDAYVAFNDENYLINAKEIILFICNNQCSEEGKLRRNYKNGVSSIDGLLEDYATVVEALLALYHITFDWFWLTKAELLCEYVFIKFSDPSDPMFFFTSIDSPALFVRKKEISDNVISSSNSIMARNLFRLGTIIDKQKYKDHAKKMVDSILLYVAHKSTATFHANWCSTFIDIYHFDCEIAIVGDQALPISHQLRKYLENSVLIGSLKNIDGGEELKLKHVDGRTMIYICKDQFCLAPMSDTNEALRYFFDNHNITTF